MALVDDLEGHLPVDRRGAYVAAGDVGGVLALLVVGALSHGTDPVADPAGTAETAAPFVIAWLVVGPAAGAYAAETIADSRRSLGVAALAWLAAANVGLILRSSPAFDGGASWPFNLIITGLGVVVLGLWRTAYASATGSSR